MGETPQCDVVWDTERSEVEEGDPQEPGICTPAQSAERASEKSQGEMTQGCPQLAKKVTARLEAGKSPLVPSPVLSPPTLT